MSSLTKLIAPVHGLIGLWIKYLIYLISLGATDEQLDFPVVYTSALQGYATLDLNEPSDDMKPLFETIIKHVTAATSGSRMALSKCKSVHLDYSSYVGTIGIGRITRGQVKTNMPVTIIDREGKMRAGRILQVLGYLGLERIEVPEANAGDIVAITGIEGLNISDTLCDPD